MNKKLKTEKDYAEQLRDFKKQRDDLGKLIAQLEEEVREQFCFFDDDQQSSTDSEFFKFTRSRKLIADQADLQTYYMKNARLRGFFKLSVSVSDADKLPNLPYETAFQKTAVKVR